MKKLVLSLAAALLAVACGQGAPTGSDAAQGAADVASGIFPNLFQTAYRVEANIRNTETGETSPIVMIRDGRKMRMEFSSAEGSGVIISDGDTGEAIIIMEANGRRFAMRNNNAAESFKAPEEYWAGELAETATFAGPCIHLGEAGGEWRRTDETGDTASCVTADGVILWATQNGERTWETTSIQRGPQSADLFTVPPGVEVLDLGGLAGMIEGARGGN
jgi:hypothetical protein